MFERNETPVENGERAILREDSANFPTRTANHDTRVDPSGHAFGLANPEGSSQPAIPENSQSLVTFPDSDCKM